MKHLALYGHQVDVISHYPPKVTLENYNHIVNLAGMQSPSVNNLTVSKALNIGEDVTTFIAINCGNQLCEIMGLDEIQNLLKNPPNDPAYDLVITEAFGAHCFMGFGHVLKVPVITVTSGLDYPWISYFSSNDNLAHVRNALYNDDATHMNFLQRLKNVIVYYHEIFKFHRLMYETQTRLMRRYLVPEIPDIREIEKNVALTLINTHPILSGVKPIAPSLIQIAGIHIDPTNEEKSMPKDLKKWMDKSTKGIVYFSLGSKVLLESLPEFQLKQIYSSFAKIHPIKVLLKVVNSTILPMGLPKNVRVMSWIPQQSVLAHPNTKIFISHGGLGGLQEALFFGIPMIGIPLFADQFRNVDGFVEKQMMIKIDFENLCESTLDSALQNLLDNPIYKYKAMYYSKLFRDQPTTPVNNAIFWIEYVIRNGPLVLKSPAFKLSLLQLTLLDIYLVLLSFACLYALIVFVIVKICITKTKNILTGRRTKVKSQ